MERTELESAVAENSHLRGLFAVPLAGLMLLSALGNWGLGPLRHAWVFLLCVALIAAPCMPLRRYYNADCGRGTTSTRQQLRAALTVVIRLPIVIGWSRLLSRGPSWWRNIPVGPAGSWCATAMPVT